MLILTVLLLLLAIGAVALAIAGAVNESKGMSVSGTIAAIVLVPLFLLSLCFVQIEAGSVGVVKRFGEIQPGTLSPGLHVLVPPFVYDVETVDTKVHQVRLENYGAASLEQQDLFLTITLNYHVDPNQAQNIIQNIGADYEAKVILPRLYDVPKTVTDDYSTITVLNKREEIRQKATDLLRDALAPFGIVVDGLVLENFNYSTEYNAAIERKQVALQDTETSRQLVLKATQEAQAAIEKAKGEAGVLRETAQGQADANRLLTESLTPELIQYQAIQKLSDRIQIMLVPSDNNFLLDLKSLTGTK